ncbi:hypothetical protein MKW98_025970 [Papaver atlanticum]|uniref:RING-type domain-containing protein n=1 Tax=Papaver atlanticum TaxID=357466 RepID=A0AAD4XMT9_9MAGN|nr:hypothetical protein MKW98_011522 [Papaver atlanticum]KAI3926336.1 hypothetical protein MKW98_025970 [Papaver atlanticum]
MKNQNNSIAIIISVIIFVLLLIIIKLLRHIIHRHFSDTTTTTTTPPSTLSSLPPPSPSPPRQIIHSPPPQIRTHSLRFLFNNQISPQPNPQSNQHNLNLINSLPTFKFESIKGIRQSSSSISSSETSTTTDTLDCAICISKFEKQDQLRLLPSCCHVFHSVCIDQWILLSNYNCPICRSDVKHVEDEDGDGELKMISSSARSFRIEIGSVSRSSRMVDESFSASDLQNQSYSLGSFEYWVQDFDAEIFVELERINENRAQSDEVSVSVGGAGGDETTEIVIENPVRAESDEAASYARSLSHALQFSDRFYGGNGLRSGGDGGGGMDEGGGGGGGRVWDLEGNRFGEEISGFFGFLSRA